MKKILVIIFIFFIFSNFIFSETNKDNYKIMDWESFFDNLINKSVSGNKARIEIKIEEFKSYSEKTKWIPKIYFDFPKLIEWQKLNNKMNLLNTSCSFKINQLLPGNGSLSFISNIKFNYILEPKAFKHSPNFSIQFEQALTKSSFNIKNEKNKLKAYTDKIKSQKDKVYYDFIKIFLNKFMYISILVKELEYIKAEYLYAVEKNNIIKQKSKTSAINKVELLQSKQNLILKKQDFELKQNEVELSLYDFFLTYSHDFEDLNKMNMDNLILFLEEKVSNFKILNEEKLKHDIFLLELEKEKLKIKTAPKIFINTSLYTNESKNTFKTSYKKSWSALNYKNDIWIPSVSLGFYWQPDYLFLTKKQINLLNLKINNIKEEIKNLQLKKEENLLYKEKSIQSLKKDLGILKETLKEQKSILDEYALLYKQNRITKLKLLEGRLYYSSQKLISAKMYKNLIDIIMDFD